MSREHELFVDLRSARRELAEANEKGRHARKQIAKIMELIDRGETQQPLLEYAEQNGQAAAGPPESADERQRGPTVGKTAAEAGPDKEWADDAAHGRLERTDGEPDPTVSQWTAWTPMAGRKNHLEMLGSFLATDEEDALAVANARWPGYDGSLEVRRAGPPAAATAAGKPKARKAAKAGV